MAGPIKVRMESDGARKVEQDVKGVDRALDRLSKRRIDTDTRRGVTSLRSYGSAARDADRALRGLSSAAGLAFRGIGYAAGTGAAAVGTGLALAINSARKFEQELANVKAVSGASRAEMKALERQAMDLAKTTKFTAIQSAQGMRELAKAGVSVEDIIGGGLKGALSLAAAGDLELADAATYAANAMNLFGLAGKDVTKIADAFATAANTTTADVADFGMAMSQGGSAAKLAGLDFIETTTILEALAKAGIKNSDAGTSMKTALLQLVNPTVKQRKEMNMLRERVDDSTLSFIDQSGKLKDAAGISEVLRKATKGMTQAERAKTLAVLAGTDGIRTVNALYEAGPKLLREYATGLSKSGTAATVAADKQKSLEGRVQRLNAALENIKIRVGNAAIPALTRLADRALTDLVPKLDRAASEIEVIWNRPGLTPEERFNQSWDAIAATGVPEKVKQGIYEGLKQVGIHGPQFLLQGLREAPWAAKGVIAALLVAKLAPAFRMLGPALGKAMGRSGGAGALGGGAGAPIPVYVVNAGPMGLGGPAGGPVPGGPGGATSRASRLARLAPATAAGALGLGAGLIAGGIALNEADKRLHFMSSDPKDYRREVKAAQDALVKAYRSSDVSGMQRSIAKATGAAFVPPDATKSWARAAKGASAAFAEAIEDGVPKTRAGANRVRTAAFQALSKLPNQAKMLAADSMVQMARSLEDKGKAPKGTTKALVAALTRELGSLPPATRAAAASSAASFGELQNTLRTLAGQVRDVVNAARSAGSAGGTGLTPGEQNRIRQGVRGYSTGGILPGTYRGMDTMTTRVAPGERILTPTQVSLADRGMPVDMAIMITGGSIGGGAMARGGIVDAALGRARGNLGEPYGKPSRGESRTGPNSWDCSGYATMVAGVNVGGTTASAYSASSKAKGGEAILWGFRKSHAGGYRGGYDEHMGVRVGGTWFQTSGGRTAQTGSDGDWQELRVPNGLSGVTGSDGDGGPGSPAELTPRQKTVRALRAAGVSGARAGGIANRVVQAGADFAGAVLGTVGRDAVGAALEGIGAARKLAKSGMSPERVAEEREAVANAGEVRRIKRDQSVLSAAVRKLRSRSRALDKDEAALLKGKRPKAARRRALRQIRTARAKLDEQLRAIYDVQAQNHVRLYELGESSREAMDAFAPEPASSPVSEAVSAYQGIGDVLTSAARDDELQDRTAQRDGEAAARAEGITDPDVISNRGQLAVAQRRKAEVSGLATQVKAAYDAVVSRRASLLKSWNDLYALLRKTPASKAKLRAMIKDDIQRVRDELDMLDGAESSLLDQYQDLQNQAAILDMDIGDLQVAISTPPTIDATDSTASDQAKADAALARRSAGLSEAFIRTALGPGDIGAGSTTALDAAGGATIFAPTIVQTLHPTDPRTLRAISEVTTSALSSVAPRLSSDVRTPL